jgi:hypothetical protein
MPMTMQNSICSQVWNGGFPWRRVLKLDAVFANGLLATSSAPLPRAPEEWLSEKSPFARK